MASSFQFGFSNPESYSDWAKYAGLDRKTGMFSDTQQTTGVAPPETFGQMVEQKLAPVQQAFSTIANVGSQIGQGNFMGAYNTMTTKPKVGVAPNLATQAPTTPQTIGPVGDYDYMHSLKNMENQ